MGQRLSACPHRHTGMRKCCRRILRRTIEIHESRLGTLQSSRIGVPLQFTHDKGAAGLIAQDNSGNYPANPQPGYGYQRNEADLRDTTSIRVEPVRNFVCGV